MSTVSRHIEVHAPPSVALATWSHFVRWVMNGRQRLACDELACVDAVRAGLVSFEPVDAGSRTDVIFNLECDEENGPSREVLEQNVARDLVVFKDYIERGGQSGRQAHEGGRAGDGRGRGAPQSSAVASAHRRRERGGLVPGPLPFVSGESRRGNGHEGGAPRKRGTALVVVSLNLRHGRAWDGLHSWPLRRRAAATLHRRTSAPKSSACRRCTGSSSATWRTASAATRP